MKYKIGQKVYLPELEVIGTVESLDKHGNPDKIKVGTRIIRAVDFIIENIPTIMIILQYIKKIFK